MSDADAQVFEDHLNRNFASDHYTPGQALIPDSANLRTGQGWLYLVTIIGVATHMVVGWQLADHMRTWALMRSAGRPEPSQAVQREF